MLAGEVRSRQNGSYYCLSISLRPSRDLSPFLRDNTKGEVLVICLCVIWERGNLLVMPCY